MAEKSRIAIISVKSAHALGLASSLRKASQARVELLSTQQSIEKIIKKKGSTPCFLLIDTAALPQLDSTLSIEDILHLFRQRCPIASILVCATPDCMRQRLSLRRAGATHVLALPIDREEVQIIVQQALGQARSIKALENASDSVVSAAERRARTMRAIHEVAASINSALDLTEVRLRTCRAAVEMFGVDHSGMVEFDASYTSGRVVAEYPQQNVQGTMIPLRGIPAEERLISRHEPIVISDLTVEAVKDLGSVAQVLQRFHIQSILIVPIISEGRVVGSFSLDAIGRRRDFNADEIECCEVLAAQVAVTIEKTRLLHETKRHASQLEALRRSSLALTSELDLDRLFQKITAAAVDLLGARSSGIYEYQEELDTLTLVADHNHAAELRGQVLQRGEGMAGRILAQQLPVLEIADYPNWDGRARAYREHCPFNAVIAVPITWHKQFKGVLYVDSAAGRMYTGHDRYHLQLLADHAAIALNNAHLIVAQSRYQEQLAQLTEASPHIMGHLDGMSLQERLNVIAKTAASLLRAETSSVLLLLPGHPERLQLTAHYPPIASEAAAPPNIFAVDSTPGGGLTGYIAARKKPFRLHGAKLRRHPAVRHMAKAAEQCQALLAIPLFERRDGQPIYIGILRVANKCDHQGRVMPDTPFSDTDERLLSILADGAVAAVANAMLIEERTDQSQHWQRLVTHAPIGIIINDYSGIITTANEHAAAILLSKIEALQGRRVEQLFANDHEANSIGRELRATHGVIHREVTLRRDDGMPIPIRLAVTHLFNRQNEPSGSIGFFEDLRSSQNATRRLQLLLEINTIIARANNLREALSQLARRLVVLLEVTCCRIVLLDERSNPTDIVIMHQLERIDQHFGRMPQQSVSLAASYWPYPLDIDKESAILLQNNKTAHQFSLKMLSLSCGAQPPFQSALIVPLHGHEHLLGALELGEQRHWSRSQIEESDQDILKIIATEIGTMIERLQTADRLEYQNKRFSFFDGAVRSLHTEQTITQFYQELVRLAVNLFNGTGGALFLYHAHTGTLTVQALHGLVQSAQSVVFNHSQNLIGQIAQSGKSLTIPEQAAEKIGLDSIDVRHLQCAVLVPLVSAGEVRAVLLVGDASQLHPKIDIDAELVQRFILHAAMSMQTVQILDKEHRVFRLLNLLQNLNDFLQTSTDLADMYRALLTAVTSGDGLRLNRAVICMVSQDASILQGTDGVGHFEERDAVDAWMSVLNDRRDAIRSLIDNLHDGSMTDTPLALSIRQFSMRIDSDQQDAIYEAIHEKRGMILHRDGASWKGRLSPEFLEYYDPPSTIIIAPLLSRTRVLGVIVADNKFTRAEISTEDCEKLMTFARTAALVIENSTLLKQSETAHQLANAFLAARPPENPKHPDDILHEAIACVEETMHAMWVSIVLIDELGEPQHLISTKEGTIDRTRLLRENGISQTVMRTGKPEIFEDTLLHLHRLHPSIQQKHVKAALCLPFKRRDQCRGVVWIHFAQPRQFGSGEVEAIQLFFQRIAALYADAQRLHVLKEIHAAAQAVALAIGVEAVTQTIAAHARALTQADVALLWSYSEQQHAFLPAQSVHDGISDLQWQRIKKFCPSPHDRIAASMTGKNICVPDMLDTSETHIDTNIQKVAQIIGARSIQILGLHTGKEGLGVLVLAYRQPHSFHEDDLHASEVFAHFAALTLRQAYFQHATADIARIEQEANDTIRTIARISALESAKNALQQIVESIQSLLKCDTVVLYTYEPQRKQLYSDPVTIGIRNPNAVARIQQRILRTSLVSELLQKREARWIENVSDDPRFAQSYFVMMEEIASTAALPLTFGNMILGVIFVGYRKRHHFSQHDQEMLQLLVDQAATTIRNDQLLEEKKYTIDMLSRLQIAGTTVTDSQALPHDERTRHEITLAHILNQMLAIINPAAQPKSIGHIALVYRHTLCYVLAYPPEHLDLLEYDEYDHSTASWITRQALMKKKLMRLQEDDHDLQALSTRLHVRSGLAIPVKIGDRIIAVLTVAHPDEDAFGADDEQALQTLAGYAAVAIQNARLIDRLKLMTDISETATRSAVLSDDDEEIQGQLREPLPLLHNVCARLEETHVLGKPSGRTRASIWLYNAVENDLVFEVAQDTHLQLASIDTTEATRYRIALGEGICGWVAQERQRYNAGDIRISAAAPHYRRVLPKLIETRSELCIPICYGKGTEQELIGVLDLQSERSYAFDDDDEQYLEMLASQLAIIIRKAQDYQELRTARNMIAGRTALVWISMITDYWRHRIDQNANNIVYTVGYIRRFFADKLPEQVVGQLEKIDHEARNIRTQEITPPLSDEEGVDILSIDDLIRERVEQLWETERMAFVGVMPQLQLESQAQVRLSPEWFVRALDLLLYNAVAALEQVEYRELVISSMLVHNGVRIEIIDSGPGLPLEVQKVAFKRRVERPQGLGIGLVMIQIIIETYGGQVSVQKTGPNGTIMAIVLPTV